MTTLALAHRFKHHPPSTAEVRLAHEEVRDQAAIIARRFNRLLPDGREKSLAITKIEEAMFWANAAIARYQGSEGGVTF